MARIAEWRDDFGGGLVAGGTSTAYTLTTNKVFASLGELNGQIISCQLNTANGASATLAVDGLTAKAIKVDSSNAIPAGTIPAGSRWDFSYNSTGGYFLAKNFPAAFQNGVFAGTISAGGAATFSSTVAIASSISAGGAATLSSTLDVTGAATFASSISAGGTLTVSAINGAVVASQSDQETGSSTSVFVTPGRQHFHDSAAKVWCSAGVTGNVLDSFNMTSVTDTGTGQITFTYATDFSSTNVASITMGTVTVSRMWSNIHPQNAGSVLAVCTDTSNNGVDPAQWSHVAFGDQ
jgi:hypothetical protein